MVGGGAKILIIDMVAVRFHVIVNLMMKMSKNIVNYYYNVCFQV